MAVSSIDFIVLTLISAVVGWLVAGHIFFSLVIGSHKTLEASALGFLLKFLSLVSNLPLHEPCKLIDKASIFAEVIVQAMKGGIDEILLSV